MSEQELQALYLSLLKREMAQRARLFKTLIATYGESVLAVVTQNTITETRERLARAALPQRDLNIILEILWKQSTVTSDFIIEAQTPELLQLKITRCLFAEEMRQLHADDIGYAFYCAYDDGFCQGLNPALQFTRTKTLMAGDDCCNHTYRLPSR